MAHAITKLKKYLEKLTLAKILHLHNVIVKKKGNITLQKFLLFCIKFYCVKMPIFQHFLDITYPSRN